MTIRQTSLQAYNEIKGKLGKKQRKVLEAIEMIERVRKQAPTNMEISTFLGWSINRVTPRTLELRRKGEIEQKGTRECNITGRMAMTWTHKKH